MKNDRKTNKLQIKFVSKSKSMGHLLLADCVGLAPPMSVGLFLKISLEAYKVAADDEPGV
jgi:hypothetical protein